LWSLAAIVNPTLAQASLTPDMPGPYVVSLVVNDGIVDSEASNVTIAAIITKDVVTQKLRNTMGVINSLAPSAFKNKNMRETLTKKIVEVVVKIDNGLYAEALEKLENDILAKTDGCATEGKPDKNDWIIDCTSQGQVYPGLMNAILQLMLLI
jgi:hypothetical protein